MPCVVLSFGNGNLECSIVCGCEPLEGYVQGPQYVLSSQLDDVQCEAGPDEDNDYVYVLFYSPKGRLNIDISAKFLVHALTSIRLFACLHEGNPGFTNKIPW